MATAKSATNFQGTRNLLQKPSIQKVPCLLVKNHFADLRFGLQRYGHVIWSKGQI
jgi:hypothetical protein